ncbi:MAG: hypothetical protein H7336_10470 [Bacteriovorax sp.]|nr:hypothetical protein [Bacteriovorax sp.]
MKKSLLLILPAVFAFNITNVKALEIDEKLTLRFLKVSETKKTVLINRGGEDGLIVGDHAKFFITAGVVARGMVEKVSPSRSVWSLYRVVDPNEITQDKVLNLKIASPVKITDDSSRSLKEEVIPGGNEKMDVASPTEGGATSDNPDEIMNNADKNELKDLGINEDGGADEVANVKETKKTSAKKASKIISSKKSTAKNTTVSEEAPEEYTPNNNSKTWEVWGTLALNSLTGTVTSTAAATTNAASTGASNSSTDISAGVEKYFLKSNNFLKEFSFGIMIHKVAVENGDQIKSKTDIIEYGGVLNYHFYNSAASTNKLIGFVTGTLGKGSATIASTSVVSGVSTEDSVKGDTSFLSAGVGAKYVLTNSFGIRAVLDFYKTTETYAFDASTTTRTLSGPRVQFGLSYRF